MNTESSHDLCELPAAVQQSGSADQKYVVGKAPRKRNSMKQSCCSVCEKSLMKQNLKRHIVENHPEVINSLKKINWNTIQYRKTVTCKVCGKNTRSDNLKKHINAKHQEFVKKTVNGSRKNTTNSVEMTATFDKTKFLESIVTPVEQKITKMIEKTVSDVANQVKQEFVQAVNTVMS